MNLRNYSGDYNIGLDMGTGSVGWAVTDDQASFCILRSSRHGAVVCSIVRSRRPRRAFIVGSVAVTCAAAGALTYCKSCSSLR